MSVLSPEDQRPDAPLGDLLPEPEHRRPGERPIGDSTGSPSFEWQGVLDDLSNRTMIGIATAGVAVIGLLALLVATSGGGDGAATLTGPAGDREAEAVSDGDGGQLVNRSGDGADLEPLGARGLGAGDAADLGDSSSPAGSSDDSADSADDSAASPGKRGDDPEGDADWNGSTADSATPSIPVAMGPTSTAGAPETSAPDTAPPSTDPPTTPAPASSAPTTAAPATSPPTSPPPTAAPTTAPPATAAPETQPPAPTGGSTEQQVLGLVNAERAKAGCPAVSLNGQLNAAALSHSQDMSANGYFSHTGRNGSQPWDRAQDAGYSYQSIGENIAQGYGSPEAVMNGWMNSSGHRANILNCNFTEMGVGLASGNYWTQLFGRPR